MLWRLVLQVLSVLYLVSSVIWAVELLSSTLVDVWDSLQVIARYLKHLAT